MKRCMRRLVVLPALGRGAGSDVEPGEPRLVADEFQETLARISAVTAKSPEALEFPPQEARFVRVEIHETSGGAAGDRRTGNLRSRREENLALAERGAVASASSLLPGHAIHQIKHLNDGQYGNDHSWIAATSGRSGPRSNCPNRRRWPASWSPATAPASTATASRRCSRCSSRRMGSSGSRPPSANGRESIGLAGCHTSRSAGCPSRLGTDSCSTLFCASGRPGATSRRTITCRRCRSSGQLCRAVAVLGPHRASRAAGTGAGAV